MQHRTHTHIPTRVAVLAAIIAGGAFLAAPVAGAAVSAGERSSSAATACLLAGDANTVNCTTTTTTTSTSTTTTSTSTTTTVPESTTTTVPTSVLGVTTVPTTVPVSVAGITATQSSGVVTPNQTGLSALATTGPTDSSALPVGLSLVLVGGTLVLLSVRATRSARQEI